MASIQDRFGPQLRYAIIAAPCALIGIALAAKGANQADLAALLSCALLALLLLALAFARRSLLKRVLQQNAVPLFTALLFVAWNGLTAWRFPDQGAPEALRALIHPAWRQNLSAAAGAISISPFRTLEGIASLLSAIAAFALGALLISERSDRDRLGRVISALALILAIIALTQHFKFDGVYERLEANLGSANSAATLFGVLCLYLIALIVRGAKGALGRPRQHVPRLLRFALPLMTAPISTIALVLSAACLFLTASRAGIAAAILSVLLFCALLLKPNKAAKAQANFFLPGVIILLAILAASGLQFAIERSSLFNADAETRHTMAMAHWRVFMERPLLGHGMNAFHELNMLAQTKENWPALHTIGAAHNIFIQTLEETGVIGLLAYVLMLGPPLFAALFNAALGQSGREWSAAAFSGFALALVHGWVDFGLQTPAIAALLCFMLGACPLRPKAA